MNKIEFLNVYLERRTSRLYVGKLFRKEDLFIFEYDKKYAYLDNSIPIGPDLPLTKRTHKSESLFPSFSDRIPSRKNPAYEEYCEKFNIPLNERDELILLSTIGKRGPSSFVFEAEDVLVYDGIEYTKFREDLDLTLRDFATIFDISKATLQKLEKGPKGGKEVLKRIEIYDRFPEVALFELNKNGKLIHSAKKELIEKILKEKISYKKKRDKESRNNS